MTDHHYLPRNLLEDVLGTGGAFADDVYVRQLVVHNQRPMLKQSKQHLYVYLTLTLMVLF